MALEDFEKSLVEEQRRENADIGEHKNKGHKRHHHSRHGKHHRDAEDGQRHKRQRRSRDDGSTHGYRRRSRNQDHNQGRSGELDEEGEDDWVEKNAQDTSGPSNLEIASEPQAEVKRDSWMEMPSGLEVEIKNRPHTNLSEPTTSKSTKADFELKIHDNELNKHHLQELASGKEEEQLECLQQPAQHEVDYVFGDDGAQWRMMKLKAVHRQADETGKPVEEVALDKYGDLRAFDDAREEQIELERRETYGDGYVGNIKPSGELFQERKLEAGVHRQKASSSTANKDSPPRIHSLETSMPKPETTQLDQTALNRLKAQIMKAQLRGSTEAAELEAQYNLAAAGFANRKQSEVVVLGTMDNRMLAGGRQGEVKKVDNKRGRERGLVEEDEDMSIEDMVREERRTRGKAGGEGQRFAERIAKDGKFDNGLDYMEENADKLAKRVHKSEVNLRNTAILDFQKMNRILDTCPLCYHEDTDTPPMAPVVSLATRVYLTLPTEPEISEGGACIIPIQHRTNLLECDDDEWEEIRNFMKSLTRMYHDQGRSVIFYENAAVPHRKKHAGMEVVPLPYSLGETAPAFFREAILTADEEWTQHKKLIDTLSKARQGLGRMAFRRTLAKEMPYFHVWFEIDGGFGHIVEDSNRWPKGDLFAREVLGGMLDVGVDVVKRQGKWNRGDRRVDGFRKRWQKFDWTKVLSS